jgi:hypothetical protein
LAVLGGVPEETADPFEILTMIPDSLPFKAKSTFEFVDSNALPNS